MRLSKYSCLHFSREYSPRLTCRAATGEYCLILIVTPFSKQKTLINTLPTFTREKYLKIYIRKTLV